MRCAGCGGLRAIGIVCKVDDDDRTDKALLRLALMELEDGKQKNRYFPPWQAQQTDNPPHPPLFSGKIPAILERNSFFLFSSSNDVFFNAI